MIYIYSADRNGLRKYGLIITIFKRNLSKVMTKKVHRLIDRRYTVINVWPIFKNPKRLEKKRIRKERKERERL